MNSIAQSPDDLIEDFVQSVADALVAFDLWCVFENPPEDHQAAIERHRLYFSSARHAHLTTAIVALYRLFESNTRTVNIEQLLESLDQVRSGFRNEVDNLESLQSDAKVIWTKIAILRNNVFGHRNKDLSVDDFFERASLTISDVWKLIHLCQDISKAIKNAWDGSAPVWPEYPKQALLDLLRTLGTESPE